MVHKWILSSFAFFKFSFLDWFAHFEAEEKLNEHLFKWSQFLAPIKGNVIM